MTRALFGLTSSPFLLGGVIQHLLDSCRERYPEIVREIEKSLYVDGFISGAPTSKKAKVIKSTSTSIFPEGTFELHKWHSNVNELEAVSLEPGPEEETYAKEQLNIPRREGDHGIKKTTLLPRAYRWRRLNLQSLESLARSQRYMTHWDWHLPSHWGVNSFTMTCVTLNLTGTTSCQMTVSYTHLTLPTSDLV